MMPDKKKKIVVVSAGPDVPPELAKMLAEQAMDADLPEMPEACDMGEAEEEGEEEGENESENEGEDKIELTSAALAKLIAQLNKA